MKANYLRAYDEMNHERLALRYVGHRPGASLSYFSGHSMSLVFGEVFQIPPAGLIIGRAESAGLRLASSQVARAHVRIWPTVERLAVQDLGTTNGTSVNGTLIRTAAVSPGDVITVASAFDFEVVAV